MIRKTKFLVIRLVELFPFVHTFIYNNIYRLPFLFPHEKDYHGLNLLIKNTDKGDFIDVGGNIGLSVLGFRKLGFKNKIHIFEPKKYCLNRLTKINKRLGNIKLYNYGLSSKNKKLNLFTPIFKGRLYHFFTSQNKNYTIKRLKKLYKNKYKEFYFEKEVCHFFRFENIKKNIRPIFIKIDVEGHDHDVIKGMLPTLKKFKPIILAEYNSENFKLIYKMLNKIYNFHLYNLESNKLNVLSKKKINKLMRRDFRDNHLTKERNIFLVRK